MWCVVMFDLPVKTKLQRSQATSFRNLLLDLGFWRCQYSVYTMYCLTAGGSRVPVQKLKSALPAGGQVRIVHISDQQWAKAIRFSNGDPDERGEQPDQLTLF